MTLLIKIKRKIKAERLKFYTKAANYPLSFSTYGLNAYEKIIKKIKNEAKGKILNFSEGANSNYVQYVFRHDLDTVDCLKNFKYFVDIHKKFQIPLTAFVRMDEMDYQSDLSSQYLNDYIDTISIGLHSSAYINNDPYNALKIEVEKFQKYYNFSPNFLTLHGLGTFKYEERLSFMKKMSNKYEDFGFTFVDFLPELRSYDYVIQDCHLTNSKRYLKKDFSMLPPSIKGACYLILIHPCYWSED